MSLLACPFTLSYNGITFNSSTRCRVRTRFEYDGADRTVACSVHTLSVSTYIQSGSGIDSTILDIRQRLAHPGKELVYSTSGFGGLSINTGATKDVKWGPKPRELSFEVIGSMNAAKLDWQVEVAIPDCTAARFQNALMAYNYELDFAINAFGRTTRTYSGYIEIPMTRIAGGRAMPDSVDAYRNLIGIALPQGFRVQNENFRISADKRRLDFTIVHDELPTNLPPFVVRAGGRHSVRSQKSFFGPYTSSLSCQYEMASHAQKWLAYEAFAALVNARVRAMNGSPVFTSFTASEGLYDDEDSVAFEISWMVTNNTSEIIKRSGLFTPVPGGNPNHWSTSIGVRGGAGLASNRSDDAIIDLCLVSTPSQLTGRGVARLPGNRFPGESTLKSPTPSEDESYLDYVCELSYQTLYNKSKMKPIPANELKHSSSGESTLQTISNRSGAGIAAAGAQAVSLRPAGQIITPMTGSPPTDKDRHRVSPTYIVFVTGYAVRAGHKPNLPQLKTVGGASVSPRWEKVVPSTLANANGVPVYGLQWALEYDLDEAPDQGSVANPPNPAIGTSG